VRRLLFVVAFAALAACRREPPPQPLLPAAPPDDHYERVSLTNIARGATIVSRTGEAYLMAAADAVIDGDPASFWVNPPRDLPQSIVIALPAPSRIDRVGLRTPKKAYTANRVQFDGSLDGVAWRPLIAATAIVTDAAQWFDIAPAEAAYLRVTVLDARPPYADVRIASVLARGTEFDPPNAGAIDGCWSLNGREAVFASRGGRVTGTLAIGEQPLLLDGGSDGRVFRFVWIRGNDYGLALMTVSPDGKHLTAVEWHEEAIPLFKGESWFGERCGRAEARPTLRDDVPLALLRRVGRYSAFGLRFRDDGTLDAAASREAVDDLKKLIASLRVPARIVVHEFREETPAQNKAKAQREIESLKAAGLNAPFVAAGSDAPRQQPVTEAMRLIYSSVDLEIRR
jgi:hypothetical protein